MAAGLEGDLPAGAALIAGGGGALGRAICVRLAQTGAPVIVGGTSRDGAADAVADEIRASGGQATAALLDLRSQADIQACLKTAEDLGGLGTVVYAAGARPAFQPVSTTPIEEWRRVMELDIFGLIALSTAALPLLRRSQGSLVTITTYQAQRLEARGGLSAVPKAAAERLIAVIAREEARYGVRANAIRSGWIRVGWGASGLAAEGTEDKILKKIPLGRFGAPEDIAEGVAYLASRRAKFTTGAVLTIDGGQSL
jgi:NAD(P)-dependent dehydrogenase (short-subunit alcohol dehydrogenase family)